MNQRFSQKPSLEGGLGGCPRASTLGSSGQRNIGELTILKHAFTHQTLPQGRAFEFNTQIPKYPNTRGVQ
jgi:hypothetical protein